jgi:hypothetical protein
MSCILGLVIYKVRNFLREWQNTGIFLIISTLQRVTLRQRVFSARPYISGRFPSFLHTSYNNHPSIVDVKMGNDGVYK